MSKKEKILIGIVIIFILSLFAISISLFKSPTTLKEEKVSEKIEAKEGPTESEIEKTEKLENLAYLYIENEKYQGAVNEGESVYSFMANLQKNGEFTFKDKTYSGLGKFVEEINGIRGKDGKYWIYYVNGEKAKIGVSKYELKPGDVVSWKYEDDLQDY